jgi:hypothetical protein
MKSLLHQLNSTLSSPTNRGISHKLWKLLILAGVTGINSAILATTSPLKVLAGNLEFSTGSYLSPPSGPATSAGPATLLENTTGSTFVSYTPSITISIGFSNQQYPNGLTLGSSGGTTSKALVAAPVFNRMNTFGGPTDPLFTATPISPIGTGISVVDNYAFQMLASVEPLATANLPTNGRYYYGDLTLTFNRPVSDPVIQMVGMGGSTSFTSNGVTSIHGHSAEFELTTPGITASKLSGSTYLDVTNNKITNTAAVITAACGTGAACGSVRFTGTNITSLTFRVYVRGDSQSGPWAVSTAVLPTAGHAADAFLFGGVSVAKPVTVAGSVFRDTNGLTDNLVNGTGTNAGGLFANLVDTNGRVVASTSVAANGTYSFSAIGAGQYRVSLSTTAGIQGTIAPAPNLPTGWVNRGEGIAPAGDGTVDGQTTITVGAVDLPGINFGIDRPITNQPPDTTPLTAAAQLNPGGTATVQVPTLAGIDPEDGPLGSGSTFRIVTLPTNADLYYNGVRITIPNFTITNYNPTLLTLDPNDGAMTVGFTYAAVDAAGQVDPTPATVTMPFTVPVGGSITIAGSVFNDANSSQVQDGTEAGTNGGGLNAVLVNSNNQVVATVAVAADGTYTFNNVPTNANYTIAITTGTAIVGSAPPAVTLPTGWVSTGENLNGVIDATVDGQLSITATSSNVTGANFGIKLAGKPQVLLIKRFTGINGSTTGRDINGNAIDFAKVTDDTNTTDDNNANWPKDYLTGTIDAGVAKIGDQLEYTIYFLSSGTNLAKNAMICDRIPDHTTFFPTGFNTGSFIPDPSGLPGADRGIALSLGGSNVALSNAGDGDRGQFFPAGVEPNTVYPKINCGGTNTNGAVVVNLGDLPNATTPGVPANSYGFIRFRAQVK